MNELRERQTLQSVTKDQPDGEKRKGKKNSQHRETTLIIISCQSENG